MLVSRAKHFVLPPLKKSMKGYCILLRVSFCKKRTLVPGFYLKKITPEKIPPKKRLPQKDIIPKETTPYLKKKLPLTLKGGVFSGAIFLRYKIPRWEENPKKRTSKGVSFRGFFSWGKEKGTKDYPWKENPRKETNPKEYRDSLVSRKEKPRKNTREHPKGFFGVPNSIFSGVFFSGAVLYPLGGKGLSFQGFSFQGRKEKRLPQEDCPRKDSIFLRAVFLGSLFYPKKTAPRRGNLFGGAALLG